MAQTAVYLMPGLGAGPKIFKYLKWSDDFQVNYLHWIKPLSETESLEQYTHRLLQQVKHEQPVLLGVSFGGIIIQEMSKQIKVKKLIIVSSIKNHQELPPFYQIAQKTRLYKLFPAKILQNIDWFEKIAPPSRFKRKMQFYQNFIEMSDPMYIRWAIKQVLFWKQTQKLTNFIHIIGEKDPIFPAKYIKDPKIVVPNGQHDMIISQSYWFNRYISDRL